MTVLKDSCHRPINYLRISITDRCNLRCIYCLPVDGACLLPRDNMLSYEEIVAVTRIAADLGINKVRLTGGEPLVRANLIHLIAKLSEIDTIDDISLTTNGILLKEFALDLKKAGLKRVNVSLDSLKPDKFEYITRHNKLDEVLQGIEAAREAGLNPVKINMVAMRGINDDEILDFARRTITDGWHVRFIEVMPFNDDSNEVCSAINKNNSHNDYQFIAVQELVECITGLGLLEPVSSIRGNGPAKYYRFSGATGTIGFISPVSQCFCDQCNRLRLTADGKLRPCLLSDKEIDIREVLRTSASPERLREVIMDAIEAKPRRHHLSQGEHPHKRFMSQVGG